MPSKSNAFDLRTWIEKARAIGQLADVEGADLRFELGAITDLNAKRRGPALLFRSFAGFPDGYGVLTGATLSPRTLGLTLGIDDARDPMGLSNRVAEVLQTLDGRAREFPVEYVTDGPVLENRRAGGEVDLGIFPTPTWHEADGGAFIGTGCVQIHRDPETGWTNMAAYRVQRHGPDTVGNFIGPGHHGNLIRRKYWDRSEPCPVVMVFGAHPLFLLIGGLDVPAGIDELTWVGAIAGHRVPVIRGPVTGLPIPADAEIAIEGFVSAGDEHDEGPFGEFTGYYAGGRAREPLVRVKALYYRADPILLGAPPARPPHDFSFGYSVMRSAAVKESLRKAGVPGVRAVWAAEVGGSRMWVVVSIRQQYAGHATQAAHVAVQCQAGGMMNRYAIVVDEDIDPSNLDEVIWAIGTRSDPGSDIDIVRHCWSNSLDPMIPAADKAAGRLWNSRAIINACRPWDRLQAHDFPPVAEASAALMDATRKKWATLFRDIG